MWVGAHLVATVRDVPRQQQEVNGWSVRQVKLQRAQNPALHPQQLLLTVRVRHQVAQLRYLNPHTHTQPCRALMQQ